MSPDVEWHIGGETGQDTIVKTPPRPRSPRWRGWAVAFAVMLGLGLGVLYRSIPGPPPKPAATPMPTRTAVPPPPLEYAIDREAQAIAIGDMENFMALQDADDAEWRQEQAAAFRTCGKPSTGDLYTVVETGTLSNNRAWADVTQFCDDQYLRQLRFYQLRNNQWWRIQPALDSSFWGEQQATQTEHFDVIFRAKDAALVQALADGYERFYTQVCRDLGCDSTGSPSTERFTLSVLPEISEAASHWDGPGQPIRLTLPSPRLTGLCVRGLRDDTLDNNELIEQYTFNKPLLASLGAYTASGGAKRWAKDQSGSPFIGLIGEWELMRLVPGFPDNTSYVRGVLANADVPPLESTWMWPITYTQGIDESQWAEAHALITFIDEQYGPDQVARFLQAIGPAKSLPEAIEISRLSYDEFEQNWQVWLKKFVAAKK